MFNTGFRSGTPYSDTSKYSKHLLTEAKKCRRGVSVFVAGSSRCPCVPKILGVWKRMCGSSFSEGMGNKRKEGKRKKAETCEYLPFLPHKHTQLLLLPPLPYRQMSHAHTLAHTKYPWHWWSKILHSLCCSYSPTHAYSPNPMLWHPRDKMNFMCVAPLGQCLLREARRTPTNTNVTETKKRFDI